MNPDTAPPQALLDQIIATLLAFFGVPVRFVLHVLQGHVVKKARFAHALQICKQRGFVLRYFGESDETVEKRMKYIAWIANDPWGARRYMVRRIRGWEAHRYASYVTVLCAPPRVMGGAPVLVRAFAAPLPDTS